MTFVLNDENITNSYGFRILTDGISLARFKENPVLLNNHAAMNHYVIGRWENLTKENGRLMADANFDEEDETAKQIKRKVERNYIKGVSMGISFKEEDLIRQEDKVVLTKCELYEASIVPIPSNANALKLYKDDKELTQEEIKTLCLSIKNETEKQKQNMTMNFKPAVLVALSLQEGATAEQVETAILGLVEETSQLKEQLQLSEEKVNAFLAKEQAQKEAQTQLLLDEAVKSGRITADKRPHFAELAAQNFELAKNILESLPQKQTFSKGITTPAGVTGVATMEDFQKLTLSEQLAFKNQNPEAYKNIINN